MSADRGWMAPRDGGYRPRDDGKPQGNPPAGRGGVGAGLFAGETVVCPECLAHVFPKTHGCTGGSPQ